jgi:integrase
MLCENLSQEKVQAFSNHLLNQNLSVSTVQAVVSFFKSGVKSAMVGEILNVSLPKNITPEVEILSRDEQKRLMESAKIYDKNIYAAVMVCLYLGLRIGEICGLKYEDIDFKENILRVKRTMGRIKNDKNGAENKTKIELLPPKSASSARKIPVPAFIMSLLKEHRLKNGGDFVLWRNGKFIEPRSLQYHFQKVLEGGGIKHIKFHATRHTFVTRALEKNIDIKTISEILGHSSAVVTLNKYAHVLDARKREQLELLSELCD